MDTFTQCYYYCYIKRSRSLKTLGAYRSSGDGISRYIVYTPYRYTERFKTFSIIIIIIILHREHIRSALYSDIFSCSLFAPQNHRHHHREKTVLLLLLLYVVADYNITRNILSLLLYTQRERERAWPSPRFQLDGTRVSVCIDCRAFFADDSYHSLWGPSIGGWRKKIIIINKTTAEKKWISANLWRSILLYTRVIYIYIIYICALLCIARVYKSEPSAAGRARLPVIWNRRRPLDINVLSGLHAIIYGTPVKRTTPHPAT